MVKNFVSNKDETVRMFKSDFMEALSKVHWTVPLYFYVPVVLYFLYRSLYIFGESIENTILYFVLGLFFWTFAEYFLHRFLFHFHPKSEVGKKIIWTFHGVHHDYPSDSKRLVMPPSASIPLAIIFYVLFYYTLGNIITAPFFAGFITGYLIYDITHYAIHHFNMRSKLMLAIKNHHMLHHFKDPQNGFGVSQPVWDHVFGTTFPHKQNKKK